MPPCNPAAPPPSRRKLLIGATGAIASGLGVFGGRAAFDAMAAANGLATRTRAGMAFQTTVALTVAGRDPVALDRAITAGFAGIRAVENASSVYRPDSDLSRLNREGKIVDPDRHLVKLLSYALDLAAASEGHFDPTVQPLWDLWASANAAGGRPDAAALRETLRRVDWRGITLDDHAIAFDRPGMAVTLNSINQGYAADIVMAILRDHGITDAFVDTGEFGAQGRHPDGRGWRLGVAAPRATETLAFTLDPFRRFAATSGDYKTAFSPDFRDHHIFDPRLGYSPPDWSSITVLAPSGLVADGLSTALFVMDEPMARRFLAGQPDCRARFFGKDGRESITMA
jgi:thiamine biosynthesis lipoprotein